MASGYDSQVEQVVLALLAFVELTYTLGDGGQILLDLLFIAVSLEFLERCFLLQANGCVVNLEDVNGILVLQTILVGTHDGL